MKKHLAAKLKSYRLINGLKGNVPFGKSYYMLLSGAETEQRRKAILLLMERWAKNAGTKQKALLLSEKNPRLKKGKQKPPFSFSV